LSFVFVGDVTPATFNEPMNARFSNIHLPEQQGTQNQGSLVNQNVIDVTEL
jgi:hypothetical protein